MNKNFLRNLIFCGFVGYGGAKAVRADVNIPEIIRPIDIPEFTKDLEAPVDSLDNILFDIQSQLQSSASSIGGEDIDVIGRGNTINLLNLGTARRDSLKATAELIKSSTLGKFVTYNNVVADRALSTFEKALLSNVELAQDERDTYTRIGGFQNYTRVEDDIAVFNQNVFDLLALAEDDTTAKADEELVVENVEVSGDYEEHEDEYEGEYDYTKMKKRESAFGASYGNGMVGGFAKVMYGITNRHKLGAGIGYAEQIGKDKSTLATQRNPITGARLEASETKDRSRLEAGLEWSYNLGESPFSLRAVLGGGRTTLDNTVVEQLYDKNNNLFGPGNKDSFDERKWYWKFSPGAAVESGNISIEGYAGVIKYSNDKKAEFRARIGYRF